MSVLNHLQLTGSNLVLSQLEHIEIRNALAQVLQELKEHSPSIEKIVPFGSYTHDTMLTRHADKDAHVDLMIIYEDGAELEPKVLYERLIISIKALYGEASLTSRAPDLNLEMGNARIRLVPAYKDWWGTHIADPRNARNNWTSTNPEKILQEINNKNKLYKNEIKRLIRLFKYWNILNGRLYRSYDLELFILSTLMTAGRNLSDYFKAVAERLRTPSGANEQEANLLLLKENLQKGIDMENDGMPLEADSMIHIILPPL